MVGLLTKLIISRATTTRMIDECGVTLIHGHSAHHIQVHRDLCSYNARTTALALTSLPA
jgi:hypothetical protein